MFFHDSEKHHTPHIHAEHQGRVAVYSITDGSVLAGSIPSGKHKLVVAWIEFHREDSAADWELAVNGQTPLPIRGLDQ
jgi:hypothetical protein